MDKNKNSYIFIYSVILVVVVAGVLSLVAVLLQPNRAEKKHFGSIEGYSRDEGCGSHIRQDGQGNCS